MGRRAPNVWKVLGIAGAVGVVATGALMARNERQRRAYTPSQVRDRLRERHAEVRANARAAPVEGHPD